MTTTDCVLVMTTLPASGDAAAFARTIVDEKLAACVNILPEMQSTYRWKGSIERDAERQLLIKTTAESVEALWTRVRELHPYEVPEFLVIPVVGGNPSYLEWIRESTK